MTVTVRVLYVDDEPDLLDIGKLFLEESGDFTVTTTLSAADALRLLEQEKFEAIVSDYQMPGMDGIQFLVEVRSRFGPIPFILFTGRGREEVVIQAINSGADFYLQKGGEPGAQFAELSHKVKQAALRNRADDALKRSEEKYRHLIEHSNEAIIVAQDGMLKLVNHRLIELLGYSEPELLSTPFPVFIHPDDRAMVVEQYHKRLRGEGLPSRYPFRLNSKNENILWVEISAVVIDWDGRPATLNFLTDITERKRTDDSLREEQQFSKLMLDSLPGIFYLYTYPENRMIRWNKQHETLLGYTAEEIKGKLGTDLHLPEHKDAVLKAIDMVMEKGQSSVESTLMAKDGHLIPFFFTGVRFEVPGQLYFMGIGIDITERKLAEQKLVVVKQRLEEAHRLAHIGTWDWVIATDTVTWSEELCNIAGWDPSLPAPTYADLPQVYTPGSWERLSAAVTRALTTDEPYNLELEMLRPDGSIRWTNAFGGVIHDGNGKVTGLHGTVQDITERKRMVDALRESEERYRSLFEDSRDAIMILSSEGRFIAANPATIQLFAFKDEQNFIACSPASVSPEYQPDGVLSTVKSQKMIRLALDKGSNFFEWTHRKSDGTDFPATVLLSRVQSSGTQLLQATVRDITERKQVEKALKESEEKFHTLYQHMTEGATLHELTYNEQGIPEDYVIIETNPAFEKLLGISRDTVIGKTSKKAYGVTEPPYLEIYSRVALTGEPVSFETYFPPLAKHFSISVYCPKKGMFATIFKDISDQKRTEEELFKKNEELFASFEQIAASEEELRGNLDELARQEKALRESEASLRAILDATPFPVALVDILDNNINYWSRSALTLFGHTAPTAAEWYLLAYPDPVYRQDVIDRWRPYLEKAKLSGEPVNTGEYRVTCRDGSVRICELYATFLADKLIVTFNDVTENKMAEEKLRASEDARSAMMNGITESAFMITPEGIVLTANETVALRFGLKRADELVGKNAFELLPEDTKKNRRLKIQKVLQSGQPVQFEDVRNGRVISQTIYPVKDPDGTVSRLAIFGNDITEHKQAEKELFESQERYSSLFSNNYSVSLLIDPNTGRIVDANAAACDYYGYSHKQLEGMGIYEINRQDKDKVIRNLSRARNERHFFSTHYLADGKQRNVEIYSGPILVKGETLFYSIIHDVTDKVKAEEALREANKKLNLLSSITRHDINNQLSVLQGYLRILEKKQPDPTLIEYFQKAAFAAQRISAMIQFTKEYESIGVTASVWQDCRIVVDTAAKQTPLGNVIIKNDLPTMSEIFADPLIVKVFYNLMDNAVRYGGKITTIRFSVEERGNDQIVICQDDGDGVIAEEKEKIFEKGYGKNTGMGLFLAREILEITGITICENGEPGKGARFEITVPKGAWRTAGKGA